MSKINILDSTVFNRIAAGEVVERPCSIVKELIENSIDAGATLISVDIKNGGLSQIRIVDNGCGIDADDLEKAFLPHATSKIKNLSDLNAIATLGFRGEALTSIASVAKITLTSKTSNDAIGNYIVLENGKILEKGERGCSQGTTVLVEDLFKNIPARAKFLSKPSVEESVITDTIARLIMTNPDKSIRYGADGKTVYQSSGMGLKSAIYTVYGKEFVDNMTPIESVMSDITLRGYINKPYYTKPNRTYQTLIVNGRYVVSSDISFCIYNCYRDYLMKRQFPAFILTLDIPRDMVDVNVHPNKLEVKFADFDALKRVIYNAVKNKLDQMTQIPKEIGADPVRSDTPPVSITKYRINEETGEVSKQSAQSSSTRSKHEESLGTFFTLSSNEPHIQSTAKINSPIPSALGELGNKINNYNPLTYSKYLSTITEEPNTQNDEPLNFGIQSNTNTDSDITQYEQLSFTDCNNSKSNDSALKNRMIKTVLFDTYIVIEKGDDIYLVDQHAAHERLLYDKLVKQLETKSVIMQDMLVPYIFNVSSTEAELLNGRLDEIESCGFILSSLGGGTFSLSAVPLICADMETEKFISLILGEMSNSKLKKLDFVKDILMQSACKAAVKGQDKLPESEIEYLLKQFTSGDKVLMCPHGRPLMVKINKSEIEKWFKRVV